MVTSAPPPSVPGDPAQAEPIRVSQLIAAAQAHMAEFGDTPVGIVLNRTVNGRTHFIVEDVLWTGRDCYEVGGEQVFELIGETDV